MQILVPRVLHKASLNGSQLDVFNLSLPVEEADWQGSTLFIQSRVLGIGIVGLAKPEHLAYDHGASRRCGNDSLIWPQDDGLIWPSLGGGRLLLTRLLTTRRR